MKVIVSTLLLTVSFVCLLPHASQAQLAEAPVYKDGEWWKISVELRYGAKSWKTEHCHDSYSEYLIRVEQNKKKVYGLKGEKQEEIDCREILEQVLGVETVSEVRSQKYLAYPMTVGKSWTGRIAVQKGHPVTTKSRARDVNWQDLEYIVSAWEKVKTPKEELDAFKIEILGWRWGQAPTYYYAPAAKAIVFFRQEHEHVTRTVTLRDYSVSQ